MRRASGLFPRVFGSVSNRGTPARGMIIAAALASGLIAMNFTRSLVQLFTFIILLATLSTLIPYTFCSLAGFMLAGQSRAMRMTRAATGIAVLAFAYSMYAIAGAGAEVIYSGFLLLMSGLPVYVWVARGRA